MLRMRVGVCKAFARDKRDREGKRVNYITSALHVVLMLGAAVAIVQPPNGKYKDKVPTTRDVRVTRKNTWLPEDSTEYLNQHQPLPTSGCLERKSKCRRI